MEYKLRRFITAALFIASLAFAEEPSAFNAGGSTSQKTEMQLLNERLFNLFVQVKNIQESQEGLQSVFGGQIQRIQDNVNKIELLRGENNAAIAEVREHVDSNFALQNENIEKIKQSVSALGALIKKTNENMQSEIELLKNEIFLLRNMDSTKIDSTSQEANQEIKNKDEANLQTSKDNNSIQNESLQESSEANLKEEPQVKKSEEKVENVESKLNKTDIKQEQDSKEIENNKDDKNEVKLESKEIKDKNKEKDSKDSSELLKNKKPATIFKEAESAFKDKDYTKAEIYYQHLIKESYKPARSNYMLGEISFIQKKYEDAIYYYKTSATRYDKADYMPNLMLNSAKSFIALNEKDNAKRFLDTLITLYPKSNEAKEAKKLLK
ncbi:MAG: hypothetical protein PUB96_03540 [Helicobacteraceae bacterium]|nr:hypothetical protein [Helicobacteraceae bacterium]